MFSGLTRRVSKSTDEMVDVGICLPKSVWNVSTNDLESFIVLKCESLLLFAEKFNGHVPK